MKFFVSFLALVLASPLALGATKHTRTVDADSDSDASTTTTTIRHHNHSESEAVVRDITPEFGLVLGDETFNNSSTHTGLLIGGAIDLFRFGSNWTFETGLQYKQMGTTTGNTSFTMNYITIPLAAKYYFSGESATGLYGKGGFVPGLNVSHSATTTDGGQTNTSDVQGVNTLDLGILVGIGGKLMLSRNMALLLEADYVRGITGLYSPTTYNPAVAQIMPSVNDTSITFLTGFTLGML